MTVTGSRKDAYAYASRSKTLFIIRGAPGSGKTTYAQKILSDHHFEADMYHDMQGGYKPENLPAAHQWCQDSVREAMKTGAKQVVVSNTFIKNWEIEPYVDMADEYGYDIKVAELDGRWKNVRGVPEDNVREMREGMEKLDCGYRWGRLGGYIVRKKSNGQHLSPRVAKEHRLHVI